MGYQWPIGHNWGAKVRIDTHVHSRYSPDSTETLYTICKRAQSMLAGFCVTDHLDIGHPEAAFDEVPDFGALLGEIEQMRIQFPTVTILFGVEAGFIAHTAAATQQVISAYPFDYVLNSVHVVDGVDAFDREIYFNMPQNTLTRQAAYTKYLHCVLQSVQSGCDYDTLAHVGYISRYAPYENPLLRHSDCPDIIDSILRTLIAQGKCLEVNTADVSRFLQPVPSLDVLRRYYALGGRLITLGSDAHSAENLCERFEHSTQMLQALGFRYTAHFRSRHMYMHVL